MQFQSHIGAIRIAHTYPVAYINFASFQSHIGAIRILWSVRVKVIQHLFQSHIGAIRIE